MCVFLSFIYTTFIFLSIALARTPTKILEVIVVTFVIFQTLIHPAWQNFPHTSHNHWIQSAVNRHICRGQMNTVKKHLTFEVSQHHERETLTSTSRIKFKEACTRANRIRLKNKHILRELRKDIAFINHQQVFMKEEIRDFREWTNDYKNIENSLNIPQQNKHR